METIHFLKDLLICTCFFKTSLRILYTVQLQSLQIYHEAISISHEVWTQVSKWSIFNKDIVGKQLIRCTDSISANIVEAHGRYFYKERKQFLYYSRGSLFESLTWIEIAKKRKLISENEYQQIKGKLEQLHLRIDGFIRKIHVEMQR